MQQGYVPEWEGVFEKYSCKKIHDNLWRMQNIGYEFEDLYQEAAVVFCECRSRYNVENARHFMSIYSKALHDRFYDLAIKSYKSIATSDFDDDDNSKYEPLDFSQGELRLKLGSLSDELKQVMNLIINAPEEMLKAFNLKNGRGLNNKMCKLLGLDGNVIERLKEHFA